MFSDHKAMSLEINYEKKKAVKKNTNTWRLNNMLLNNHWVTEEIKPLRMPGAQIGRAHV